MDKISVIIPSKNRKKYLASLIENLLGQTQSLTEIIIVDDHSEDGSLSWLKSVYGDKVSAIASKGEGPGAARNAGTEIASGDYIKFFDSDDLMSANTIKEQVSALKESGRGFVYSPYFRALETGNQWVSHDNIILNYRPFPSHKSLTQWMCRGLFIAIPSMLFRKELISEAGNWKTGIVSWEDWEYLWRIACIEPFPAHTHKCAFVYRQHDSQTTSDKVKDNESDLEGIEIFKTVFRDVEHIEKFRLADRLFLKNRAYRIARKLSDSHVEKDLLKEFLGIGNRWFDYYYRVYFKTGRIISGGDYLPCYGILRSKEKIDEYLALIVPK